MKIGNLARFMLMFGGVMILAMVGIMSLSRANADDEPYFLLFWCACRDGVGFYRVNPDGSGLALVTEAGLAPNTIQWSPREMTLSQMKVVAVRPGVYRMRWDGRAVRLLVEGRIDAMRTGWMSDGSMVIEIGDGLQREMSLTRVDMTTNAASMVHASISGTRAQVSPDGEWLAYQSFRRGGYWHLYIMPFAGGDEQQLTDAASNDTLIGWSPDGERLLFRRSLTTIGAPIYDIGRDGTGLRQLITKPDGFVLRDIVYSPDGRWITYSDDRGAVWIVPADGGEARRLTTSPHFEHAAAWTWDSQWIAYVQIDLAANRAALYRVRADGSDVREMLVLDGNAQNLMWSQSYALDWQPWIAVLVGVGMVMIGIGCFHAPIENHFTTPGRRAG